MKTTRLTMTQALLRYLLAQRTMLDGADVPLFPGIFAIFGHGNVTCLGEALESCRDRFPVWRGQNEQSMALAAIAFAKARRRRQIMVATSSIGPGATNMVTAAAVAHANRLPVLLLAGDRFASRLPDPVLQQVEHFGDPTVTVNDAFKPVSRYWDRISRPEQILSALPRAVETLLDPADCGPVFLGLCQDTQAEAWDYPEAFFATQYRVPRRPRPDVADLAQAAALLREARKPLLIAGGGVHYAAACGELAGFATRHRLPVAETVAGRSALVWDHPCNVGPVGLLGGDAANSLAAGADLLLAVGTRLQDFTTASWTLFRNPDMRLVTVNTARHDATKHRAHAVIGDAAVTLSELGVALEGWQAPADWAATARAATDAWNRAVDGFTAPTNDPVPAYAQVIGEVWRHAAPDDLVLSAAGGLPGEVCMNWRPRRTGSFDGEFGFSCMGYEIAGGWGAAMANPDREVIVFCGDGSYMMMNADIYSSVTSGHKMIVIVCDNGGFAVINRLQVATGNAPFNNLLTDCRGDRAGVRVDFARHAQSMGALAETVEGTAGLAGALARARAADRTSVIVIRTRPDAWTPNQAFWQVGVPEVSPRADVRDALAAHREGLKSQRRGV